MGVVSVWSYLFWDVQQHKDQPHLHNSTYATNAKALPLPKHKRFQDLHETGLPACTAVRVLTTHLEYP